jgi:hypothetical protein
VEGREGEGRGVRPSTEKSITSEYGLYDYIETLSGVNKLWISVISVTLSACSGS